MLEMFSLYVWRNACGMTMEINKENTYQHQCLRRLKPYQRIQLVFELHDVARSRVAGEIKRRHPDLTNEERREKLNQRFIR